MTHPRRLLIVAGFLGAVSLLITLTPTAPAVAQMKELLVLVTNPASAPVLTRNVDNPTRTPFSKKCTTRSDFSGDNACEVFVVPPDKVLVVEMFSGFASAVSGDADAIVVVATLGFISGELFVEPTFVEAIPVFTGPAFDFPARQYTFSQPLRAYLPAGTVLRANVRTVKAHSQFAAFNVFGYLVDCVPGGGCPIP